MTGQPDDSEERQEVKRAFNSGLNDAQSPTKAVKDEDVEEDWNNGLSEGSATASAIVQKIDKDMETPEKKPINKLNANRRRKTKLEVLEEKQVDVEKVRIGPFILVVSSSRKRSNSTFVLPTVTASFGGFTFYRVNPLPSHSSIPCTYVFPLLLCGYFHVIGHEGRLQRRLVFH